MNKEPRVVQNNKIFKPLSPLPVVLAALLSLLLIAGCATVPAVNNDPLAAIRNNKAKLQYFFSQMPKGADLHNHLTGSVYAETYFDIAVNEGMYLDPQTFRLYRQGDSGIPSQAIQLGPDMPNLHSIRVQCIDHWSVRNYGRYTQTLPPDEFFFGTFGIFGSANRSTANGITLLRELRQRAADENVAYLEIMLTSPAVSASVSGNTALSERLKAGIQARNGAAFQSLLGEIWNAWEANADIQRDIGEYVRLIEEVHVSAADAGPGVLSRYQTYCSRSGNPLSVFAQLYIGFNACAQSPLLVGVNIVSAENGEVALRDYWGHMEMFRYLKTKIPAVKTAMHAGELRLGLTPPEDLNFHITDAVFQAGADRIGHGVDIVFETDARRTLDYMAAQKIPVEINLTSNEFILGVKGGEHPLMFYHDHGVPIVLSTDDPGILRSDLTDQYVLAAQRYGELGYPDFKQFAYNSIIYSFLPEAEKDSLIAGLDNRFRNFEREMGIE
jgi:adenosine deaminase